MVLANGNRRRSRQSQNGVQAIFSIEESWKGKVTAPIGLLAIGTGTALWAWTIQTSSPLRLVTFSILLVIGGVGLSAYSLAVRSTRHENNRIRSALYTLEAMVEPKNVPTNPVSETVSNIGPVRLPSSSRHISKTLAVALVEAVLLIVAYAGLVQEYSSNLNMQQWVHANIFLVSYALNYKALFVVAGTLLGALVFQRRLGKRD